MPTCSLIIVLCVHNLTTIIVGMTLGAFYMIMSWMKGQTLRLNTVIVG